MHVNCHVSPSLSLFYLCFPLFVSIFSSFFFVSFREDRSTRYWQKEFHSWVNGNGSGEDKDIALVDLDTEIHNLWRSGSRSGIEEGRAQETSY